MSRPKKSIDPDKARISYTSTDDPLFKRLIMGTLEYATGRRRLEKLYSEVKRLPPQGAGVWQLLLEKLQVHMIYDDRQLKKAPGGGPVIVIANHPFGVVDGLILGYMLSQMREQFFVLVNEVLCREPLLAPYLLPIDFRDTKEAMATNILTRKLAMERMQAGSIMGIFPSGGVATAPRIWKKAEDLEWKRFVVKMIRQMQATVIPMYIHGRNSHLFQMASQVSLNLRLSLLLNEARNKIGKKILINIGDPIAFSEIEHLKDRQEMLDFLRQTTEALQFKP